MEVKDIVASVNIMSPLPDGYPIQDGFVVEDCVYSVKSNIDYTEPLVEADEILTNGVYKVNVAKYKEGLPCCVRPGFQYRFWFKNIEIARQYAEKFNGKLEIPPVIPR